jgi:hypothetical protein
MVLEVSLLLLDNHQGHPDGKAFQVTVVTEMVSLPLIEHLLCAGGFSFSSLYLVMQAVLFLLTR